jgi:hypothetical protein
MRKPETIIVSETDFAAMKGDRVIASGSWDDVEEVRAYKRDEVTTDLICVEMRMRDGTGWLAHEEAPGWDEFLEMAERTLPAIEPRRSWELEIVKPAFKRKERVIFRRLSPAV